MTTPIDVVDLTRRLVNTPSPVRDGDERAVARLIDDTLAELGLPAAETHALVPERPNLTVTLDFGPGGHHLALVGHIDTKPVGDAEWTRDPFAAAIEGDRMYGLGTADMKGGVAAMLVAAAELAAAPPTSGRLTLVFTADEEDGAAYGSRFLADKVALDADALVIGEPSGMHEDFDGLHLVSRGLGRFRIAARARQGHSGLSSLLGSRNAGIDLARALVDISDNFAPTIPENVDGLRDWMATVNAGLVLGGGFGYGVLPGVVSSIVEVRTLPGMDADATLAELQAFVAALAAKTGATYDVEVDDPPRHWLIGTEVAASAAIVDALRTASSSVLGVEPALSVFPGTTDASWFSLARPELPCLPAFGPGLLRTAHGADEWVSVSAVRQTVPLYAALTRDFCQIDKGADT